MNKAERGSWQSLEIESRATDFSHTSALNTELQQLDNYHYVRSLVFV